MSSFNCDVWKYKGKYYSYYISRFKKTTPRSVRFKPTGARGSIKLFVHDIHKLGDDQLYFHKDMTLIGNVI